MNPNGVLSVKSNFSVHETAERVVYILHLAGATVYARIDQHAELAKANLVIRPMEFILFGNPVAGGPMIMQNPLVALDLPLKLLIYENESSETWVSYNNASYIAGRYDLKEGSFGPLLLDKIVNRAIAD